MIEDDRDWIGCAESLRLIDSKKTGEAKNLLITRLRRGMLDARAEVFTSQYSNVFEQVWDGEWERTFPREMEDVTRRLCLVPTAFWNHKFEDDCNDESFGGEIADWEAGDFTHWQAHLHGDEEGWERHSVAGATFSRRQLSAYLGMETAGSQENGRAGRRSTYNWEVAFADVAADLYHNLEFEDVDARGVPAKLVAALQRSFEDRGLQVPEHSSLKTKAKILAGALRSKK